MQTILTISGICALAYVAMKAIIWTTDRVERVFSRPRCRCYEVKGSDLIAMLQIENRVKGGRE